MVVVRTKMSFFFLWRNGCWGCSLQNLSVLPKFQCRHAYLTYMGGVPNESRPCINVRAQHLLLPCVCNLHMLAALQLPAPHRFLHPEIDAHPEIDSERILHSDQGRIEAGIQRVTPAAAAPAAGSSVQPRSHLVHDRDGCGCICNGRSRCCASASSRAHTSLLYTCLQRKQCKELIRRLHTIVYV